MSLKEKILKGKEYTKNVYVEAYDTDVVIKPLTSGQLEEVLRILEERGINVSDTESLQKSLYKNISAMRIVCKYGLADPDERDLVDDIIGGDAVAVIGMEILAITNSSNKEMADFFKTPETKI